LGWFRTLQVYPAVPIIPTQHILHKIRGQCAPDDEGRDDPQNVGLLTIQTQPLAQEYFIENLSF
jgi:hypothetical protein